jgi:hypothetical protein
MICRQSQYIVLRSIKPGLVAGAGASFHHQSHLLRAHHRRLRTCKMNSVILLFDQQENIWILAKRL